jgi:PAS domain S-box-containing protein
MKQAVEKRTLAGYLAALVILCVIGWVAYRSTARMAQNADRVRESEELLRTLVTLLASVSAAESAERGYVITGDESFAEACQQAQDRAERRFQDLRPFGTHNAQRRRHLDELEPALTARLNTTRDRITIRRTQGLDRAQQEVAKGEGARLQSQIGEIAGQLEQEERELLEQCALATRANSDLTWRVTTIGSVLAFLLVGAALLGVHKAVAARQKADAEVRKAQEELERRVAQRTAALTRTNQALSAIGECNRALAEAADEEQLLRHTCQVMVEVADYRLAWIGYAERDPEQTVRLMAHAGYVADVVETLKLTWADTERGRGPTGTAICTGLPCVIRDYQTDDRCVPWRAEAARHGLACAIAVPLTAGATVLGALGVASTRADAFDPAATELLSGLAKNLARGIAALRERRRRERAEEQMRVTLESIGDGFVALNAEWRFLYVNAAAELLLGIRRQEVSGREFWEVFPSIPGTPLETELRRAATGEIREFEHSNTPWKHWLQGRCFPRDGGGVTVYFRDITARKQAEEELKSAKAFLDLAIDFSPFAMWISNTEGTVTRVNRSLCDALNLTEDQVVGKYNVLQDANLELQGVMPQVRAVYEKHEPTRFNIPWVSSRAGRGDFTDARELHLDVSMFPILNARGDLTHVVCQWVDITEQKRAQELLRQQNEELTRFTYTVSHDLKSPLVTIRTFLGYLEKDLKKGDAASVRTDLGHMRRAADRMGDLLDELLELSRIGRKMSAPEDVPLPTLAREALDLVAGAVAERHVQVKVTDAPVILRGDRRRLLEVFQNLLDNAVKFMGDQPDPRVEVGAEPRGSELVLFVRDNGMGIDPRHIGKLFGLFEKLDPATPGTGIGLALVKRIVEVHGGRIWAESAGPGQGTVFYFTLKPTPQT